MGWILYLICNWLSVNTYLSDSLLSFQARFKLIDKKLISPNKASGGDEIPVELFQILKDDAALNLPANMKNSEVTTGLEKVSFHSNSKERQCQRILKLPHNWTHLSR